MREDSTRPFKVVIVGGGLVGLTAAHILSRTDIDFEILEQHDNLMPSIGSLLSLWPPTFRVFDQLGILDQLRPVMDEIHRSAFFSADDGSMYREEDLGTLLEKNHGYGLRVTHRPLFVEALYRSLPAAAKARIHVGKRVVDIAVAPGGVVVRCDDGTAHEGSVVVGADGVHSRTRQCMQALATGARAPGVGEQAEMQGPYVTTYRLLFGNFAIPPGMERNVNWEGVREDISTQILTGGKRAWFAVYEKLEEPTAKRLRYTEEEKERVVAKWGDLYMAPGYKMRDVYKMLEGPVGMINLEEGLVDQWSWKRVVLVGDAVRKLEPHAGLGYNSGVADVVTLVNGLRRLLRTEASPSTASLEALFASYRDDRMRDMPAIVDMSMRRARMCAWLSWGDKMMAKYAIPYLPIGALSVNYILGPIVSRVPVLEWLDESGLPEAAIPYEHHALPVEEREKASLDFRVASRSKSLFGLSNYTTALVLATAATIGLRYYQRV